MDVPKAPLVVEGEHRNIDHHRRMPSERRSVNYRNSVCKNALISWAIHEETGVIDGAAR
jgi:hypothetical protein